MSKGQTSWLVALVSGGVAGTAVDVALFPLDTIKTRMQAKQGFWRAGGLQNVYAGIGPAAAGSAPTAALFFCTYEVTKSALNGLGVGSHLANMAAASAGEVAACLVRVPTEIVKQRRQASSGGIGSLDIVRSAVRDEGLFRGLFRGYVSTVLREVPFSLIQLPLWELLKSSWATKTGQDVSPLQSAVCGSAAGFVSAAATTPLDVAKTRIMLSEAGSEMADRASTTHALSTVWRENGVRGVFAGVVPRTVMISAGGFIFFGAYDKVKESIKLYA